ncbi:DUF4389 domain-containing protein [Chloroflexota bacterium]
MAKTQGAYPATLSVDFPDGKRNRLTSFFRVFTVIPIAIILGLILSAATQWGSGDAESGWTYQYAAGGLLFLPLLLMILFRKKYPRWWFDWNLALTKFSTRVTVYCMLLRDEYPSTDEEQAVHIEIPYPDAEGELMRGMPLVKWFLAIPHYIVLFFLNIAVCVVSVIAWFAILFVGRYPKDLFDFVAGVLQWELRVSAYTVLLTTDRYPPFQLTD